MKALKIFYQKLSDGTIWLPIKFAVGQEFPGNAAPFFEV
jgi:hypothetical protein